MIYLLVALTFLASIMFYSFYPRSDAIELIDKPSANNAVFELVAQHSAVVQAATVVVKPSADDSKQEKYMNYEIFFDQAKYELDKGDITKQEYGTGAGRFQTWPRFLGAKPSAALCTTQGIAAPVVPYDFYEEYLPVGFRNYEPSPQSFLLCVNNDDAKPTTCCGKTGLSGNSYGIHSGTSDFIITITPIVSISASFGIPEQERLLARALGENAFLTKYDHDVARNVCFNKGNAYVGCDSTHTDIVNKAHLTTNCGIIVHKPRSGNANYYKNKDYDPNNAEYVLTNTRYETVTLPRSFTKNYGSTKNRIGDRTHLACITELRLTYAGCDELKCDTISQAYMCGTVSNPYSSSNQDSRGCAWDTTTSKCKYVCTHPSVINNKAQCDNNVQYGCVWSSAKNQCETNCGNVMVYPMQNISNL